MDVDGAIEDGHLVADGGVDNLVARQNAAGAGEDEMKDAEFGGS